MADLYSNNAADLAVAKAALHVSDPGNIFAGLPIVASRATGFSDNTDLLSNGTDTLGTYRVSHVLQVDARSIRLVYGNHQQGNVVGVNAITVKASVEPSRTTQPMSNSGMTPVRVTFAGQESVVIQPGAFVISDPVPVYGRAGEYVYSRTYVSVSSGEKWPRSLTTLGGYQGHTVGAPGTDVTGGGAVTEASVYAYSPIALVGQTSGAYPRVVALTGDSIGFGQGGSFSDSGYLIKAFTALLIPCIQLCKPGEGAAVVGPTAGAIPYSIRLRMASACTNALDAYGANDWSTGFTLAQCQGYRIAHWRQLAGVGCRTQAVTCTPRTTSSDSWATVGNQTVTANEAVRVGLNDWVRDGSPLNATTFAPVAVGGSGIRCGETGHPLSLGRDGSVCIDLADTSETSRNSGKWNITGGAWTGDGTHPTENGHTRMAAAITATNLA